MDQITHEVRRKNWAQIIEACNSSGLTKAEWCRQNGINQKSFYYRQKQLRQETFALQPTAQASLTEEVAFVELPLPEDVPLKSKPARRGFHPDAVIRTPSLTIEMTSQVSDEILALIREVLRHAT